MNIEEIKDILYKYYEVDEEYADGERGCYVNGYWLSINQIIEILERGY